MNAAVGEGQNWQQHILTEADPTFTFEWPTKDGSYVPIVLVDEGFYNYDVNDPSAWEWALLHEDRIALPAGVDQIATVWALHAQLGVFDADHLGGTPGQVYVEYHNDGNQPLVVTDATGSRTIAGGEMLRVEWPFGGQAIAWTATAESDGHAVSSGNLLPPT